MCFSAEVSAFTFVFGAITATLLILYGNPKYKAENTVFGIFLIFIAGVQLVDFFLWIDLDNKMGINHLTTLIGPLYVLGQPVVLYLIKMLYFAPKLEIFGITVLITNVLYVLYLGRVYMNFLKDGELKTGTDKGHIVWPWTKFSTEQYYYCIILAINIFYLTKFNYSLIAFLITFGLGIVSTMHFSYSPGELWCFFGCSIPLLVAISSYFI